MTDSGRSLENAFSKTALWNGSMRKDYVKFTDELGEMSNRHAFEVVGIRRESSSRTRPYDLKLFQLYREICNTYTIGGNLCFSDSHAVSSCYVICSNHLHSLQVIFTTADDTYSDNSPNSQDSYNTTALHSDTSYANTPPFSLAQICNSGRSSSLSCQPVRALSALQHPADKPLRVQPLNIKRTFEYGRRSRWLGVR